MPTYEQTYERPANYDAHVSLARIIERLKENLPACFPEVLRWVDTESLIGNEAAWYKKGMQEMVLLAYETLREES